MSDLEDGRVYIAHDAGRQHGPLTIDELREMRALGGLSHLAQVTVAGWEKWFPITEVLSPPAESLSPPAESVSPTRLAVRAARAQMDARALSPAEMSPAEALQQMAGGAAPVSVHFHQPAPTPPHYYAPPPKQHHPFAWGFLVTLGVLVAVGAVLLGFCVMGEFDRQLRSYPLNRHLTTQSALI